MKLLLLAPGVVEEDIPRSAPEVFPVRGERVFHPFQDVSAFGFHDLFKGLRHVRVERRHQSWFEFQPEFLHVRRIEGKIVFAEGAHAHQGHPAPQEIGQLGQFVDPERPQHLAPGGHAEIVLELSPLLQGVGLEYVILQIFTVGMHGAELGNVYGFPMLSQAFQADQGSIGGVGIRFVGSGFFQDEMHHAVDLALVDQFKAAEIEAPQHLGLGKSAVPPLGEGEIPALQNREFWHHAPEEEIEEIHDNAQKRSKLLIELIPALGDGLSPANEHPAIEQ